MTATPFDPREVFVFAGAGLSRSGPTSLAMFDGLRDALLRGLDLGRYVPVWGTDLTEEQRRIKGIQPEPFFAALEAAGVDAQTWLVKVLDPADALPNAAHRAIAELCLAGARTWTVNFDTFIEQSMPGISVVAQPDDPDETAGRPELLKPHGSIGGRLIVTPQETLSRPPEAWRRRLRSDLDACRHVVFIGYSGRDFDYRQMWNELLTDQTVWWFDMPGSDVEFKEHLLRATAAKGLLRFPKATEHTGADGSSFFNPSWDFIYWCQEHGLVSDLTDADRDSLLKSGPRTDLPQVPMASEVARADFAILLGDLRQARRLLGRALLDRWQRRRAAARLWTLFANQPSTLGRWVTSAWWLIPARPWGTTRRRVRDKYLAQLSNATRHQRVITLSDRWQRQGRLSSAAFGLQLAALKMQGDVAAVIDRACAAVKNRLSDNNTVRCNAAFHWCHGLLWAGRYAELRSALDDEFRPLAGITNTRWMAWADYIEACLLIADPNLRHGDEHAAAVMDLLDAAEQRFTSEANWSGLVDIRTVRLTALRQQCAVEAYVQAAAALADEDHRKPMKVFAAQAVMLELAQMLAYHLNDRDSALGIVEPLRQSSFPVHATLATALKGQWDEDTSVGDKLLQETIRTARPGGLDRAADFAAQLLARSAADRYSVELFFP
jgi:hypothetical protein